jgi:hypothetical protein
MGESHAQTTLLDDEQRRFQSGEYRGITSSGAPRAVLPLLLALGTIVVGVRAVVGAVVAGSVVGYEVWVH